MAPRITVTIPVTFTVDPVVYGAHNGVCERIAEDLCRTVTGELEEFRRTIYYAVTTLGKPVISDTHDDPSVVES